MPDRRGTALLGRTTAALAAWRSAGARSPLLGRFSGENEADPRPAIAQGLLAATMIMVGSWGVGWLATSQQSVFSRTTLLVPLRVEPAGVIACTVLLALGSMVLCRAWVRLAQRSGPRGSWDAAPIRRAVLVWSAPLMLSFPVFSRDVYSYFGQGRLMAVGMSPYEHWISQLPGWFAEGSDSLWAESPSPYGPLFLLLAGSVYRLTGGVPEAGVALFRLFAVLGVLLCATALPRLARALGGDPAWALWVSVANPLFLLSMVAGVHNDAVMVGGILWGFVLALRGRRVAAALVVALAIGVKPIALMVLPFLGLAMAGRGARWPERIRAWLLTAATAAAALAAAGWATGLWFGWLPAMATAGSAAFPYAPVGLLGLFVGWVASLFGADLDAAAAVVYSLFKAAAVAFAVWLALGRPGGPPVRHAGHALAAAVVLAPIIQPWYLLWLAPLYAASRSRRDGAALAWILLSMVLVLVGVVDQLSVAQWISLALVRILAAAIGLAFLAYLVFLDPKASTVFARPSRNGAPTQ